MTYKEKVERLLSLGWTKDERGIIRPPEIPKKTNKKDQINEIDENVNELKSQVKKLSNQITALTKEIKEKRPERKYTIIDMVYFRHPKDAQLYDGTIIEYLWLGKKWGCKVAYTDADGKDQTIFIDERWIGKK